MRSAWPTASARSRRRSPSSTPRWRCRSSACPDTRTTPTPTPTVQHHPGDHHDAHGDAHGVRGLPLLAARRARLRGGGALPGGGGAYRGDHREPLRRGRGAAHRGLHPVPLSALAHRSGVRARYGVRAQAHPAGATAAGADPRRASSPLGVAAGRLRGRGGGALPAVPLLVAERPVVRLPVPPREAPADRERAGHADAVRQAHRLQRRPARGHSHGSHILLARGAGLAATALGGAHPARRSRRLSAWRRRERLRAAAPDEALAWCSPSSSR